MTESTLQKNVTQHNKTKKRDTTQQNTIQHKKQHNRIQNHLNKL